MERREAGKWNVGFSGRTIERNVSGFTDEREGSRFREKAVKTCEGRVCEGAMGKKRGGGGNERKR